MKLPFLLICNIVLNSSASFLLKLGMSDIKKEQRFSSLFLCMLSSAKVICGGLCFAAGFLVYCILLKNYPLRLVYPIVTSGSLISLTLLSWFILRETISVTSVIGFVLIFAGIFFISMNMKA